jgi:hypothetical protein
MHPPAPLDYESRPPRKSSRLSRITRSEKFLFFALVLIVPECASAGLSRQPGGNIVYAAIAAVAGGVVWRLWLVIKDIRSRRAAERKIGRRPG